MNTTSFYFINRVLTSFSIFYYDLFKMNKLAAISSLAGYLLLSTVAQAAPINVDNITVNNISNQGIAANESLQTIVRNTFTIVIVIAVLLVVGYLVYGAINWITSGGDKEKVKSARGGIINALIGLAILALAFFIVNLVGRIVGIDVLNNFSIQSIGNKAGS